ncbi:autotransporter domain-containing protein [Devosia sp.]|uniref:autotransporter domain-containing protein n=1 Tax=Devosia sp. TaxID=1871048 RepID=UPI001B01FF32|nr:autotransporter domain-containing protein [Devosia sp.]MBO9590895.1 autotransporter domain-containing protein [Devosia sp.]
MAQRPFGQQLITLHGRRRRTKALFLLGASAAVIALALPARAQSVDVVTYGDGEVRNTPIVMARQTVGNVGLDEVATQSGAISGAYKFSKSGFGALILSGANSFSGGLDINMGTVALAHRDAAGTGAISMLDNTRLRFDVNDFILSNQVNITGTAEFNGQRVTLSGVLSGDGRLVVNANLTLSGENTHSGGTDLASGQITAMNGNALGTGVLTMANNTVLAFDQNRTLAFENDIVLSGSNSYQYFQVNGPVTLDGVISGGGNIVKTGSGTLVLTGNNLYGGGTSHQAGTIRAESDNALGAGGVYFQGGATLDYADGIELGNTLYTGSGSGVALRVDTGSATHSGFITGHALAGGYYKTGNGELVVTGGAGYGGNTNVVAGKLTAGAENVLAQDSLHILGANTRFEIRGDQQIAGLSADSSSATELNDYILTLNPQRTTSTFQGQLSGSADSGLVMIGSRELTLDGDNEGYGGSLRIESGPVYVQGDYSSMSTTVNGGSLGGSGRLGNVIVNGGTLAGYDGYRLNMNSLALDANSRILAEFGAMSTDGLFNVNGDLVLDGTLDVVDVGGFDPGIYRLFDYGGTLTDRGLVISSVPAGYSPDELQVQTSVSGQVNVLRYAADVGDTLFWDGGDDTLWANGAIDGGSGSWGIDYDSFTTSDGMSNGVQSPNPGFVVFAGRAGEVNVVEPASVTGMQFATHGYELYGDDIELIDGERIIRVGDGTAAGEDYAAVISAALTGVGTLVKTDRGTLVLNSTRNSYEGGTEVRAGTLEVNGVTGSVSVGENGRLQGSGRVGNVEVAGVLGAGSAYPRPQSIAPSSFGTLNIEGDLYMSETGTVEIKVDAAGNSDLIDVDGTAYLDGQVLALASGGDYSAGVEYTFLRAEGGIEGEFDGVSANLAFLAASLAYNENDVRLHLARNALRFADIAKTANQLAAANGLESLNVGNVLYDRVLTFSAEDARAGFDQLSGEAYASTQSALIAAGQSVANAMEDRVAAAFARLAAGTQEQSGIGFNIWSSATGSVGVLEANGNAARAGFSAGNLFVGADAMFNQDWMFGAMLGFGQTSVSIADRNSTSTSNNYHVGVYGGGELDNVTLKFGAAYTQHETSTTRNVTIPGFTESLFSTRLGGTGQMFGEIGYKFAFDSGIIVEPFVNLAHASLYSGGFTERGGAAALSGGASYAGGTQLTIGLRGETSFVLGEVQATAKGMIGWRNALGTVDPTSTHAFSGGSAFTVAGASLPQGAAVIEAGLDLNLSPNVDLGIAYDGQIGSALQQHGVKANLSVKF